MVRVEIEAGAPREPARRIAGARSHIQLSVAGTGIFSILIEGTVETEQTRRLDYPREPTEHKLDAPQDRMRAMLAEKAPSARSTEESR